MVGKHRLPVHLDERALSQSIYNSSRLINKRLYCVYMFRIISRAVCSPSQNVLNFDLKKSRICPLWVSLTHFGSKSGHPDFFSFKRLFIFRVATCRVTSQTLLISQVTSSYRASFVEVVYCLIDRRLTWKIKRFHESDRFLSRHVGLSCRNIKRK